MNFNRGGSNEMAVSTSKCLNCVERVGGGGSVYGSCAEKYV